MYIDEAHMALDIFQFLVFFCLYSVSLGEVLTSAAVRPLFYPLPKYYYSNLKENRCGTLTWFQWLASKETN